MSVQLPWLLHDQMLADPVFIIVNHDEVVHRAQQHGSGDSSLYRNAMEHVNNNQVIIYGIFFLGRSSTKSILYF